MTDKDEINEQIIETIDEDGKMVKFELLDIIEYEEIEYALLMPVEEESEEEPEVVLMKLRKEGDEFVFEAIEDDDEFNRIVDFLQTIDDEEEQ